MVGRTDECMRQLKDLLHLSERANDEQIINVVKESNNIQVMLKLRKSRWTKNEVEYAQFLIEEFDSGLSKDLKAGHTKRSYLSDKLICAPMRVSKKFPGKSIGKTNFSRTSKGPDGNPLPHVILESYELRHKALRIKFLRKILSAEIKIILDTKAPMPKIIADSLLSTTRKETRAEYNEVSPKAMMFPPQLFQGPISVQANTTAQQVNATSLKPHVPLSNAIKPVPCVAPPTMVVPLRIERKPCATSSPGPPLFLQRSGFGKPVVPQDRKPKSILSTVQGSKFGNSRTDHNEIPDLLSGFDKHAASLLDQKDKYVSISIPTEQPSSDKPVHVQTADHPLFVGPIGESPYITSKSFDDLHQCLANNQIPHLDLSAGNSVQQHEQKMSLPAPTVASGVPIQVSTNNYPGAFPPYTNQQNNTQPMHMVSFMPQILSQMTNQSIQAQQGQNAAATLPMLQTSRNDVAEAVPRKTFGALSSIYNQNGTHLPFSNHAVANAFHVGGEGRTKKRRHIESGPTFNSLMNDGTKRFKSIHAVSTSGSSEPSSSDGGFDNELVFSGYDNLSASLKAHSKRLSNNSDSSETD